jgi:NAD(P)-dependent dehydrogenase (short-subunit alcohol dehydrogenase family)
MDYGLAGKTALVTGSTKGIGKATAQALAQEGAEVIINGRSEASVSAACDTLREYGKISGIAADVGSQAGAAQLLEQIRDRGPVDILVNNAGIFEPKPFEEIADADWEKFFQVNVMSGVRLSRALLPEMRDRGWGRIVFISSESGINIPEEMVHYGMTKTAQLAVARGLAKVAAGSGVTVNSVLPGPTWTEGVATFVEQMANQSDSSVEEMKANFVPQNRPSSLTQRFATPEEVAAAIVFLCSQQAASITGAANRVEGGIVNTCF